MLASERNEYWPETVALYRRAELFHKEEGCHVHFCQPNRRPPLLIDSSRLNMSAPYYAITVTVLDCTQFGKLTGLIEESADFGVDSVFRNGAPRPTKMGTIRSLWRYDAGACRALQQAVPATICDFALRVSPASRIARVAGYPSIAVVAIHLESDEKCQTHAPQ